MKDPGEGKATATHDWRRAMQRSVITIDRHILEEERLHPAATGAFSSILYDIALAAKLISREVRQAGLVDILGATDEVNVHGEQVRKLDQYAHEVLYKALDHGGYLCCMASEESEEIIPIPDRFPKGKYVVLFDPLDGSSNIDSNISVGTIFSIHRKRTPGADGTLEDCLQRGRRQVAAGYVVYGSSTMLVYTTGSGVHGFTLDPSIGEFLLSHPDIRLPVPGERIYSCNEGNYTGWSDGQRALTDHFKGAHEGGKPFKARYVGSLVADFHRTLLHGGIFMYPADTKNPHGKLRLLYEAAPMAMIMMQAGGAATNGEQDVLDVAPTELHQRTPLYVGSCEHIELARSYLAPKGSGRDPTEGDERVLAASR